MREASRTHWHQKQQKRQIYLLIPAARCSNTHSLLVKLIHVCCDETRHPRVYRQPGMIERNCRWILLPLDTPQPLHASANTVNHIHLTIESQILTQHHHIEQPLRSESCRVVFYEEVSVENPQWLLQVPDTGWWCLVHFLHTACCQSALGPFVVLLGDIIHFGSTQLCLCGGRRCWCVSLPLQLFLQRQRLR